MSQVIWCDYGDHAAKRDDTVVTMSRAAKQVTITDQFGSHVGTAGAEQVDICGTCAVELGLSNDYTAVAESERHKTIATVVKGAK